jgi:hypothetical protein
MIEGRLLKLGHVAASLMAFLLASSMVIGAAQATTMYRMSLSELTFVSDLIVLAEVEQSAPEKAPGDLYIKTVATLKIDQVVKGALIEGDRIQVREWGGSLAGEQTHLPGAPRYVVGERVMVFLERERKGSMWRTVGLSQGKMTLVEEPDTGRDITVRLRVPSSVERFDEAAVQLPAVRRYSEDLVAKVRDDLTLGFVPPYQAIPGLPPEKDRHFFEAALAAGQQLDPRWAQFQGLEARP